MRGKRAKQLRRLAESVTSEGCVYVHTNVRKYVDKDGNPLYETSTRELGDCTRGLYQFMKRKYKEQKYG